MLTPRAVSDAFAVTPRPASVAPADEGEHRARLHVAVDAHDLARDERGIGTYARAILSRFARRRDVRLTLLVREWLPRWFESGLLDAIGARPGSVRCANRVPRDADVIWHPWNGTFFASRTPAVATVHDVIPFAFPAAHATRRASQQTPFERTARMATTILCDSEFTIREVRRHLGVEPDRLVAVPPGVDAAFCPGDLAALPAILAGRRYVLHVGAHDEHKNVETLIAAHRAAFPAGDVALVLTRPHPLAGDAVVVERASQETLVALYRGATLVAVPSVYEGFRLPVVEAMACGAPVLAAHAASLPEAGGDAAAYVDEFHDPRAWRDALCDLFDAPMRREAMRMRGPQRAARFPWERCAERSLTILRAAAATARVATR